MAFSISLFYSVCTLLSFHHFVKIENKLKKKENQSLTKKSVSTMQKITPCLWVDKDAKAVVNYYLSIFVFNQ